MHPGAILYKAVKKNDSPWQGRSDAQDSMYIFQAINTLDLNQELLSDTAHALLGFCCDEGVRRNFGRLGAKDGPHVIREQLAKFANHCTSKLFDAGDVICDDDDLESAQIELSQRVFQLLNTNKTPIVLGGGHETSWGHYLGLAEFLNDKPLTIINFDAHFDMRQSKRASSGTPFLQVANACTQFDYHVTGLQSHANTTVSFDTAKKHQVHYLTADRIHAGESIDAWLEPVIESSDNIYLTVCMDVFQASIAPGVSSTQPYGLYPEQLLPAIKKIKASNKLISADVVELAPNYDIDNRTAKLAALIVSCLI